MAKSRSIAIAAEADRLIWDARRAFDNPAAEIHKRAQALVQEGANARRGVVEDEDALTVQAEAITTELEMLLPENLRLKAQEAWETTQRLLKINQHERDRADVLRREIEAARAALRETIAESRRLREREND